MKVIATIIIRTEVERAESLDEVKTELIEAAKKMSSSGLFQKNKSVAFLGSWDAQVFVSDGK